MSITNGYCTLVDIKTQKDIKTVNASDDAFIERTVEAASRYIDDYTGHRFYTTSADETRYFSTDDPYLLDVDDLISVTTLKTDVDMDRSFEYTWASTDYDLEPYNAALVSQPYTSISVSPIGNYTFPVSAKGVQIVGKFGFWTSTPADIQMACRMICLRMYQNRFGQNVDGPATITAAGVVITPSDIPSDALKILKLYKRRF